MNNELLKSRLLKIKEMADECLAALGHLGEKSTPSTAKRSVPDAEIKDMGAAIANKVGECEESDKIGKLLDKPSPEGKVLLCLFIAYKYFDRAWLTSGHIAKATAELGIKMDQGQASNKIKDLRSYVEGSASRKKGAPTLYRLNRLGLKRFEEMLNAQ